MSIASELTNLESNIGDAYDAVNDMSGIIPQHKNMANLDQAIRTIPQSAGTTYTAGNGINIDANNEISIDDTVVAELSDLPGVMTGASSSVAGASGLVPAPAAGDNYGYLKGDGTWTQVITRFIWDNGAMYDEDNNAVDGGDVYAALQSGNVEITNSMSSLIIENGIYDSWIDPTYGPLFAVLFFTVEQTSYDGVMARTQYLYDETNGWLTPNEMNIQKRLTAGSITETYLDPDLQVKELVFSYTQENSSSTDVTVDVPIDFGTYEAYYFDMIGVGTSGTVNWGIVVPLSSNKVTLSTEQYGYEQASSATLTGVARSATEMVAAGWQQNQLSYIEMVFRAAKANDYPWPCFKAMGQGAGRNQFMQGSVKESSATVKYVRFTLKAPAGNGFTKIHAYATRRRS